MCIVCGHVGCSRYSLGHARAHFEQCNSHNYAIELATQRVWDYAADCYVHRLVRNKNDGKLVELSRGDREEEERSESVAAVAAGAAAGAGGFEGGGGKSLSHLSSAAPIRSSSGGRGSFPSLSSGGGGGGGAHSAAASVVHPSSSAYASVKLEEFLLEYNYLLSSQLEQQRRIFEQSLKAKENDMTQRRLTAEKELARARQAKESVQTKLQDTLEANEASQKRMAALVSSHSSLESQAAQLALLNSKLQSSSSSLRSSLDSASSLYCSQHDSFLSSQDAHIASLEDQLHDLRFFVDTQRKIDRMDARAGKIAGKLTLKQKLNSGQAELQLVEVAPEEEDGKRKIRRKRG